MQNIDRIIDSYSAPLLQLVQSGPPKAFLRACRDCAAMTGVLFIAVLTILIIGL
jgi:hypothetical protein